MALVLGSTQILAASAYGQVHLWSDQFGSSGFDQGAGIAIDGAGNVIVAGTAEQALYPTGSVGGFDAYLRRYSADGSLQWTRQFGTSNADFGRDVAVDPTGNMFVAGFTEGSFPGHSSFGAQDAFVVAFDPTGSPIWTAQFGTLATDQGEAVAVDGQGNVYVTGMTEGQFPGEIELGIRDVFLAKMSPSGILQWIRQFGTPDEDLGMDLDVTPTGEVLVAGFLGFTPEDPPYARGFVRKFDPNGSELWAKKFGGDSRTGAYGVASDSSGGAVVVGVVFGGLPGYPGAGGNDAVVKAYDADGNDRWTDQFGSMWDDYALGVDIADDDVAVVTGVTQGALPGQSSQGGFDAWTRLFGPEGAVLATHQFGGAQSDEGDAVAAGSGYRFVIGGTTDGALPDENSAGSYDAFVVAMTWASCADVPNGTDVAEDGLVSSPVHELEPSVGSLGSVLHAANCAVIAPVGL